LLDALAEVVEVIAQSPVDKHIESRTQAAPGSLPKANQRKYRFAQSSQL
jgi:hypothetical protein